MTNCKPVTTPIIQQKSFPYRQAVDALSHLMVGTRPDIAYAVGVVSRALENPSKEDVLKVNRIMRYLKGTITFGITYKKDVNNNGLLHGYSDSDHGRDLKDGHSTSGILYTYASGAVAWASRKQSSVAISTTEAEIVAASETTREMVWLQRLFNEILVLKDIPTLHIDNDAAVKLAQNPEMHRRTKHVLSPTMSQSDISMFGKL